MVKLKCRSCGGEVDSNEKARKCRHCNELLPLECAVCAKHMRPPIPEFPIERYYNDEGEPLCADHYQRECPECGQWFRADENPGFFLCPNCTKRHQTEGATDTHSVDGNDDYDDDDADYEEADDDNEARQPRRKSAKSGCAGVSALAFLGVVALPLMRFFWH